MRHQYATPLEKYVSYGAVDWILLVLLRVLVASKWTQNWKRITWKCVFRHWRVIYTAREETKVENPLRFAQNHVYSDDIASLLLA